jgi:hypothetical protein
LGREIVTSSKSSEVMTYMFCSSCGNPSIYYPVLWLCQFDEQTYVCSSCSVNNARNPIVVYFTMTDSYIAVNPDLIHEICGVIDKPMSKAEAKKMKKPHKFKKMTIDEEDEDESTLPPTRVNMHKFSAGKKPKRSKKKKGTVAEPLQYASPYLRLLHNEITSENRNGVSSVGSVREYEYNIDITAQVKVLPKRIEQKYAMIYYAIDDTDMVAKKSKKFSFKRLTISKSDAKEHYYLNNAQQFTRNLEPGTLDIKFVSCLKTLKNRYAENTF